MLAQITDFEAASRRLKALSGRHRLQLLSHLADGECAVGVLASLTNSRETAVSQQLSILRGAGFVQSQRRGQSIFYSLTSPQVEELIDAIVSLAGIRRD